MFCLRSQKCTIFSDTVSFKMLVGFSKMIVVFLKMIVMPQSFPINILRKTILCHKSRFFESFRRSGTGKILVCSKTIVFCLKKIVKFSFETILLKPEKKGFYAVRRSRFRGSSAISSSTMMNTH